MKARRGFLLADALCALALAGILAVACASVLTQGRRLLARVESRARAERAGLEALGIAAAIARDADSIIVLGDTAIELQLRIADGVVCAVDGRALVLPPVQVASGTPLVQAAQPLEPGDELRAWVEDSVTAFRAWVASPVESVTVRTGDEPCGPAGGFVSASDAGAVRERLVLAAVDARVRAGTPVRVGRRGRLALYSAGAGQWMLGWRRCAHGACGAVQPVAGPLRSAAQAGFRARWTSGALELAVRVPGLDDTLSLPVVRTDAGR